MTATLKGGSLAPSGFLSNSKSFEEQTFSLIHIPFSLFSSLSVEATEFGYNDRRRK